MKLIEILTETQHLYLSSERGSREERIIKYMMWLATHVKSLEVKLAQISRDSHKA